MFCNIEIDRCLPVLEDTDHLKILNLGPISALNLADYLNAWPVQLNFGLVNFKSMLEKL